MAITVTVQKELAIRVASIAVFLLLVFSVALAPSGARADTQERTFVDMTWGRGKTYQNNQTPDCFWFGIGAGSGSCFRGVWSDTWLSFSSHMAGVDELALHIDPYCTWLCGDPYYSPDSLGSNPWAGWGIPYVTTGGYHYYCGLYGICNTPVNVVGFGKHYNYTVMGSQWWWTTQATYGF